MMVATPATRQRSASNDSVRLALGMAERFEYTVSGVGDFPLDPLRHDGPRRDAATERSARLDPRVARHGSARRRVVPTGIADRAWPRPVGDCGAGGAGFELRNEGTANVIGELTYTIGSRWRFAA